MPWCANDRCLGLTVQKTVEVPQVQYSDRVVDVAVHRQDWTSWPPVRRFSHLERRNKIGVIKGFTKHRQEKRLPASKHVILEDDELTENIGKDQSGKEIADMLCSMPHEKLFEVVQNCPASMLQQFVPKVSAALAPTVVSIPASSSGKRVQTPGREPGQKGMQFLSFRFWQSCWSRVSKD